jgi:hypothetical protein
MIMARGNVLNASRFECRRTTTWQAGRQELPSHSAFPYQKQTGKHSLASPVQPTAKVTPGCHTISRMGHLHRSTLVNTSRLSLSGYLCAAF